MANYKNIETNKVTSRLINDNRKIVGSHCRNSIRKRGNMDGSWIAKAQLFGNGKPTTEKR